MMTHRLSADQIALAETAILRSSPATPRSGPRTCVSRHEGLEALALETTAGLEARFLPGLGMTCCSLRIDGHELLSRRRGADAYASRGLTMGLSIMHPWTDRLAAWSYTALGHAVRLPTSPLLHTDDRCLPINGVQSLGNAWHVDAHDADARSAWLEATLRFDRREQLALFPFPHFLRFRAEVAGASLWLFTELHATTESPVPVCFGYRAHLSRDAGHETLLLPPRQHIATDERLLPTGETELRPASVTRLESQEPSEVFALRPQQRITFESSAQRLELETVSGLPFARIHAVHRAPSRLLELMTAGPDALSREAFPTSKPDRPHHAVLRLDLETLGH